MNFEIQHINTDIYKIIVFSRSAITISAYISEVSNILETNHFKGLVLFDLLLSNGTSSRYYEANFDGKDFEINTFKLNQEISDEIKSISNSYYRNNIRVLRRSILSTAEINDIIKIIRS